MQVHQPSFHRAQQPVVGIHGMLWRWRSDQSRGCEQMRPWQSPLRPWQSPCKRHRHARQLQQK
eukprot:scaffold16444_cov29-Tisochrysis_lutea.AAC.2